MKKTLIAAAAAAALALPSFAGDGTLFRFKFSKGDRLALVSRVEEDVTLNGRRLPHATILNRISMEITDVDDKGGGLAQAEFMTSESYSGGFFSAADWEEHKSSSTFRRSVLGEFTIGKELFMPIVRDVPRFPEGPVEVGGEWRADGHEAEDFRRNYGIPEPVRVPFTASYKYLRDEESESKDGGKRRLSVIQAKYALQFENPVGDDYIVNMATDPPVSTMGWSNRTIWWDNERGQMAKYVEDFRIVIETFTGNTAIFTGRTTTEVTEFKRSATDENLRIVRDEVQSLGLSDVSVEKSDKGLKISLQNIQFEPDSARLIPSEKAKIREISRILRRFRNDILVSGHTASAGNEDSCQELSERRADAVATYLENLKVRTRDHIFTEGFGSRRPVGDNESEEGRSKNRRVEITILDK